MNGEIIPFNNPSNKPVTVKDLTPEQQRLNAEACEYLIRGKTYRFEPPVLAGGTPTGGPDVCGIEDCLFSRGWYIGFIDEQHVFQGTPDPETDGRVIAIPLEYCNNEDIEQRLRACYFHVAFVGGSKAIQED